MPEDIQTKWQHFLAGVTDGLTPDDMREFSAILDEDNKAKSVGYRFGVEVPRTSPNGLRTYKVDFRVGGFRTVTIELNKNQIHYVKSTTDKNGIVHKTEEWRNVTLSMMVVHAQWMVADRIPGNKMSAKMGSDVAAVVCLLWLRSRGSFFWDEQQKGFGTSLYYDESDGVLMRVRSDEFQSFLSTASDINRESTGFKYLMSMIDDAAMSDGVSTGVTPSVMWDKRGESVYVSSGDSEMYRLSGGNVEKVQNGTDGVLFVRGKTLAPWELTDGHGVDPFTDAGIFTNATWADKTGLMNARLWVLNLFYCHATKPMLLITGIHQSGKTRMAKGIKEILGVRVEGRPDYSVLNIKDGDKGEEAFWVCLNEGKIEVFDNVDTKIKWVGNAFQTAATDGQIKQRTLYTNTGMTVLRANANMILTSNSPMFTVEGDGGMADRIITLNLLTRKMSKDVELSRQISEKRDEYLTWMVRTVAAAMADRTPVDASINTRHPDYGMFSVRCGRAFGDEQGVIEALGAAEADKCLLPLRNDLITREVLKVLQSNNWHLKFTSGEMSKMIIASMGELSDEKTAMLYSSRKIGKAISKYSQQFEKLLKWIEPRTIAGKTSYQVCGLSALGSIQLTEDVPSGGFGGFGGLNSKSHIGERESAGFTENDPTNPPNPPHARADDISSSMNEEEKERKEEGVFYGDEF